MISSEAVLNKNREHRLDVVEIDVLMLRVELERVRWGGLEWMLVRYPRNSAVAESSTCLETWRERTEEYVLRWFGVIIESPPKSDE